MTYINRHPVTIVKDGTEYRLDTLAYNIKIRNGRVGLAGMRGESVEVAGRDGSIFLGGKVREEGLVVLSMWVRDRDVDGNLVAGKTQYETWRTNMDFLLWLFDTTNTQVEFREYLVPVPAGATLTGRPYRYAKCEIRQPIDPEFKGQVYGEFKVGLRINSTFRKESTLLTFVSPLGASAIATHTMTAFNGGTAPIKELVVNVDGPITNPTITDYLSGHWIRLNETVPAGQQWAFDTETWESRVGASLEFNANSGGTRKTSTTTASGIYSPRLFAVTPSDVNTRVTLAGTAPSGTTRLRIQARRTFH